MFTGKFEKNVIIKPYKPPTESSGLSDSWDADDDFGDPEPVETFYELRDDDGIELRDDGGIELRQ